LHEKLAILVLRGQDVVPITLLLQNDIYAVFRALLLIRYLILGNAVRALQLVLVADFARRAVVRALNIAVRQWRIDGKNIIGSGRAAAISRPRPKHSKLLQDLPNCCGIGRDRCSQHSSQDQKQHVTQ